VSARKRATPRLPQPAHLCRRRTDAAFSANPIHEATAGCERDYLVERGVDRLRERARPEDLARLGHLLAVDDERGLVLFGYLFSHPLDILIAEEVGVHRPV